MSRRKTAVGIAVLFALALSAISAASSSAAGSTAFTCVKGSPQALWGPHCLGKNPEDGAKQEYKHVGFSTATTGTATNENTASGTTAASVAILKGSAAGVATTIQCTTVHGEGPLTNKEEGGEMFAHAEGVLHYSGCTVTAPKEKGCVVGNEGKINTAELTGRTVGGGENPKVLIRPKAEGANFTELSIEKCSVSGLNNTFPISGSIEVETNGATLKSVHSTITTQGLLKFAGQKAGLEGALTLKAHEKNEEETKPISVTATP